MENERANEIVMNMKSFGKEKYHKSELLSEMMLLQNEIVEAAFPNGESTEGLKIWNVENHLEQINEEKGSIADEELNRFKEESKELINLIKAEISGTKGETKAFRSLQYIKSKNIVLKNVELSDGNRRTELDAIVITPKMITIVEVKNTAKNIFIDENGDYFRTGQYLRWDCNIAERMRLKEDLLKNSLENAGIKGIQIKSIVVFTNNRIEVQNRYSGIITCFVSQLAYIIDGYKDGRLFTDEKMKRIEDAIRNVEIKEAYEFKFNVAQYKADFASLLIALEGGESSNIECDADAKPRFWEMLKKVFTFKKESLAEGVAA